MNDARTIDFPYLNYKFNKGDFVKNIIFLHFMPYLMEPNFGRTTEREKWQRLIALKTQLMILDIQDTENKKKKYKIDALNDYNTKNQQIDYFAYKLEYDFYQKLGGDEAFFNTCIWKEIENFIKSKADYLMSIYTVVKLYIDKWDEYEKDKENNEEPSLETCHIECGIDPESQKNRNRKKKFSTIQKKRDFPFQTFATYTVKENVWSSFKEIAHLIYGYVEALLENGVIQVPDKAVNKLTHIKENIAPVLIKIDDNSKYLSDILGYALKAQNYRINKVHTNSTRNTEFWMLPEQKLKDNYKIKSK